MEKNKVKILDVCVGKYSCDSITVELKDVKTEICFNKLDNVIQYIGKEVYLVNENNLYSIAPIDYSTKK